MEGLDFIKTHCANEPMLFARLSIVFLTVGNHGDISRFLQELINVFCWRELHGLSWKILLPRHKLFMYLEPLLLPPYWVLKQEFLYYPATIILLHLPLTSFLQI